MHSENCRCPDCWSLCEVMLEMTGKDYGLNPAPNRAKRAAAQTPPSGPRGGGGLRLVQSCDGSYTCRCDGCEADKAKLAGKRRPTTVPSSLPWEEARAA